MRNVSLNKQASQPAPQLKEGRLRREPRLRLGSPLLFVAFVTEANTGISGGIWASAYPARCRGRHTPWQLTEHSHCPRGAPPQCPHCVPPRRWREAHNAIHTLLPELCVTLAQHYTVQLWKANKNGMHRAHRASALLSWGRGSHGKLDRGGQSLTLRAALTESFSCQWITCPLCS